MIQEHPEETDLDEDIFAAFSKIIAPGTFETVNIPKDYLKGLPAALSNTFGVYRGSLTHPPCNRGVRWLVAEKTFHIASDKVLFSMHWHLHITIK
jgi:carbonic anhydrase